MPSLAQAIIDLAHNLNVSKSKTTSRFAENFYQYSSKDLKHQRALQYTMQASGIFQDIPLIAPLVKKALRLTIDQSVADAIVNMNKTPTETLLQALKYAEPPHNPVWIEFPLPNGSLKAGWLIEKKMENFMSTM